MVSLFHTQIICNRLLTISHISKSIEICNVAVYISIYIYFFHWERCNAVCECKIIINKKHTW